MIFMTNMIFRPYFLEQFQLFQNRVKNEKIKIVFICRIFIFSRIKGPILHRSARKSCFQGQNKKLDFSDFSKIPLKKNCIIFLV